MEIKKRALSQIKQDPDNVRVHNKKNLEAIKGSLTRFGQQKPIVVSTEGVVIAGNGTVAAAAELGWKDIDVVETKLKGQEAVAFAIADNRTAELADWDDEQLAVQLGALEDDLLESAGYTQDELIAILADFDGSPDEVVINEDSDYQMREHAAIKQIILTFTADQYVPVVEALVELRNKHGVDDFTAVVIELIKGAGHEIP